MPITPEKKILGIGAVFASFLALIASAMLGVVLAFLVLRPGYVPLADGSEVSDLVKQARETKGMYIAALVAAAYVLTQGMAEPARAAHAWWHWLMDSLSLAFPAAALIYADHVLLKEYSLFQARIYNLVLLCLLIDAWEFSWVGKALQGAMRTFFGPVRPPAPPRP